MVKKKPIFFILTGISKFEGSYSLVGGINAPKKIKCLGTDGAWRSQLVKVIFLLHIHVSRYLLASD